jgi:type VI secretion system protein ImpC
LHHPDFQSIEAAWRALYFMASRLETDSDLKLYVFDVSKPELAADLGSSDDLRPTATYKVLVEDTVETPGGEPWWVLVGNYSFDRTREDAELLGRIAKIARRAGAAFISGGGRVLGCSPWLQHRTLVIGIHQFRRRRAWEALRGLPEASYLVLRYLGSCFGFLTALIPIGGAVNEEMPGYRATIATCEASATCSARH